MKFCPICSKNFESEDKICSCGCTLLDGSHEEHIILLQDSNEELIFRLYNHLLECGISSVQHTEQNIAGEDATQTSSNYVLTVSTEEGMAAIHEILSYLNDEETKDAFFTDVLCEKIGSQMEQLLLYHTPDEGSKQFVNAKNRYEDMMSSASSMILVSVLGFIFEILIFAKIIPLNMNILFYIMCTIMLSAFLIAGFYCLIKAKKIKSEIPSEDTLIENIKTFLSEEYDASSCADAISPQMNEAEIYFVRTVKMKEQLREHFGDLDDLMMDNLIDEMYSTIYPEDTISEDIISEDD